MTVQLEPQHIAALTHILEKSSLPKGTSVYIFGSRATGKAKPFSDIDLAFESDAKIPSATFTALASAFEESPLPYKVDMVDLKDVELSFRQLVEGQKNLLLKI